MSDSRHGTRGGARAVSPLQLQVEDLVFDVVDEGPRDAPAVLLLHGFPLTSWSWRKIWPGLVDAGLRVLAPDLRGYSPGARPVNVSEYDMAHLVGDALGILYATGVESAHVVGHDWGAAIAWQLAARHADRVRSLTAVSVPHPLAFTEALRSDQDQRERSAYMLLFRQEGRAEEVLQRDGDAWLRTFFGGVQASADVEHYLALMREPGVLSRCLSYYRAASRAGNEGLLPVTVPTTYVWSDGDFALGRTAAEATHAYVTAEYRFVQLAGVSHWVPEEAPEALLTSILERVRSTPC